MTKKPPADANSRQDAATAPPGLYEKSDPIPVPDVIDDDQDASWGLWQQAVASRGFGAQVAVGHAGELGPQSVDPLEGAAIGVEWRE